MTTRTSLPNVLLPAALLLIALAGSSAAAPPPPRARAPGAPAVEPAALDLLARSRDALKALEAFSVHADATRDQVVRGGYKLQRTMSEDVAVRLPDKMRAEVDGDGGRRVFVYDGFAMVIYAGDSNTWVKVPAPSTVRDALDAMYASYDVDLPLTDLLYMATGGDLAKDVLEAGVIGRMRVGDTECDHIALRSKNVDWQVWIARSDALPRKIVITSRDEDTAPQYQAILTWQTTAKPEERTFVFNPPPGALQMGILTRRDLIDAGKVTP